MQLRDRIKEFRRVRATEIRPDPKNWRKHNTKQENALRGLLAEVGIAGALIARETPNGLMLIDGHLRADVSPDTEWPVLVLDVTEQEAAKLLATLDPIGALAKPDAEKLDGLLREIETGSEELASMLDQLAKDAGCEWSQPQEITEDEVPEPPKDPITKPGDLWTLGEHRLLCGSSHDFDDITRLMNGCKPDVAVIDPPFEAEKEWTRHIMDPCIVFGQCRHMRQIPDSLWRFERIIDKVTMHTAITTRIGSRHAIVAQCGTMRPCPDKRNKKVFPSVIQFEERPNHPHEKPVDLLVDHLTHFTPPWSIAFDPYSGSGATFIAAEHMKRKCYGCELSPAYCDVIVKRWEAATKQSATCEASGNYAQSRRPRKSLVR